MALKGNFQKEAENVVAVQTSKDPIEQQILAAANLSEAQVEAIRGFQRRKGLTFGEAAIALGLVRRDSLFLALSKRYNYPVLNFGVDEGRFSRELVVGYQPVSTAAEAFRSVRSALATGPLSQGKNALAVIGPHRKVGVTYFAANLALSFAQMAVPTLLVDENLRKPGLAALFGVDPKTEGLVEALTHGEAELPPVTIDIVPGLSLLVAGATAPHPQELLSSKEFLTLSQNAQRNYGVVIYDTPAALESADAYVVESRDGAGILGARRDPMRPKNNGKSVTGPEALQGEIAGHPLGRI